METERRVDPGDEPVAINVAKTPNACGTGGRFELLQCCKSLIMDTSGSNGHLSLDFVIRGSGVQIPPPAPYIIKNLMG